MTISPSFIGVDGGGTKCKATLFDANLQPIADGVAGPANVSRELGVAQQSIITSIELALQRAGTDPNDWLSKINVFAGLAGANIESASGALSAWHHPFKSFQFTTDLHSAAFGAHAGEDGAVLIVGTGSCSAALHQGQLTQYGGYGFLLGDKGSGAWLGKALVTKALESVDGYVDKTDLTRQLFDTYECQTPEQLVEIFNEVNPGRFARLAPMVISAASQGDLVGQIIVAEAADYLSTISERALQVSGGKLALVGGVAEVIKPWLRSDIQAACVAPQHSPEWGALYYFQKYAKGASHG